MNFLVVSKILIKWLYKIKLMKIMSKILMKKCFININMHFLGSSINQSKINNKVFDLYKIWLGPLTKNFCVHPCQILRKPSQYNCSLQINKFHLTTYKNDGLWVSSWIWKQLAVALWYGMEKNMIVMGVFQVPSKIFECTTLGFEKLIIAYEMD